MTKSRFILLFCLLGFSSAFTSCTTTNTDEEGASRGISASQTGVTRESVYEWQDRTFRQLAY
ncbi:MAG: hypothetical protein P1U68_06090 [Verrucomicrobiales bacterium]|nr:hypothetical protein [Verrucomicrobiales bacterium]